MVKLKKKKKKKTLKGQFGIRKAIVHKMPSKPVILFIVTNIIFIEVLKISYSGEFLNLRFDKIEGRNVFFFLIFSSVRVASAGAKY